MKSKYKNSVLVRDSKNSRDNENVHISIVVIWKEMKKDFLDHLYGLSQEKLDDIEVIFCEASSERSCFAELQKYILKNNSKKINCVFQKKNANQFSLDTWEMCHGKYVLFLNTEDYMDLDCIDKIYTKVTETKADILFLDLISTEDETRKLSYTDASIHLDMLKETFSFSVETCAEKIFNVMTPVLWNKLYSRDFLIEKKLEFDLSKEIFSEPTIFLSFVLARNILFWKKETHRYISDLIKEKESVWKIKYDSLWAMEKLLKNVEKYDLLEQSFLNYVLDVVGDLLNMREPSCSFFRICLEKELLPHFNLLDHPSTYFYTPALYERLLDFQKKGHSWGNFETFYVNNKKAIIPIVLPAFYDSDLLLFSTIVQGIIDKSNSDSFYDVYILHKNKNSLGIILLLESMTTKNVRVSCVDISSKAMPNLPDSLKANPEEYLFILPNFFYGYEKVLFLTKRLMLKADVSKLFNMNIDGNVLGAPRAYGNINYIERDLGLIFENFFSTDIMLINMPLWNAVSKELWDAILQNKKEYKKVFRDMLNILLYEKVKIIPDCWNIQHVLYFDEKENFYHDCDQAVINFTGTFPYTTPEIELADEWWGYARKTPLYEMLIMRFLVEEQKKNSTSSSVKVVKQNVVENSTFEKQKVVEVDVFPLMSELVKEAALSCLTFGKHRKEHRQKLNELQNEINSLKKVK